MVSEKGLPMVIDADGLKAYAKKPIKIKTPTVFTPHSKEFVLLTGKTAKGDHQEKGRIIKKEAKDLNSIILLKGNIDIISNGEYTRYNWTGNPGMTVGGTGDVLTGIVGAYLAQGANPFYAAGAAAFINGKAGDEVVDRIGYHLMPEDLIDEIPTVIMKCLRNKV